MANQEAPTSPGPLVVFLDRPITIACVHALRPEGLKAGILCVPLHDGDGDEARDECVDRGIGELAGAFCNRACPRCRMGGRGCVNRLKPPTQVFRVLWRARAFGS